eukprot:TRINITY_DN5923_c0_g2_i1.p1 TRINITY_DN5923_c0_g2~~TRINITY_DN5923_c0_g2_i1.p1  ORF type:complete len:827 (-),score=251.60 TRINITY_DN5923_c0_g2_i1:18-2384(-)
MSQQVDPSDSEQARLLAEAKNVVNTQAFQMKRALDQNKLMDALKHASNMLSELRTGLLSPKKYFELYIQASDHLRYLEFYLMDDKHGKSLNELYELVQYAGNVLPRLYLLVTVGSVYIRSKKAPAKDVLKDLVEMCRGVQHPTRGLFLRTFLSDMTKDKLPEEGNEYIGVGGDVSDSTDFILVNFIEMNKLWVRMQHQGQVRDKDRREKERRELSTLVGKNLGRLAQLEGVDAKMYKEAILPKILEQIVQCKDTIAQQYLMDSIIQAFSEEFHLKTLQLLLKSCAKMEPGVDVKSIIVSLIERLSEYIKLPDVKPSENIFNLFSKYVSKVVEERGEDMELHDVLALQVALVNLALKCYGDKQEYVDQVFAYAAARIQAAVKESSKAEVLTREVLVQAMKLLQIPLEFYKDVLKVLSLGNYASVIEALDFDNRRRIAISIIKNIIDNGTSIPESESAEKLFSLLKPLLSDAADKRDLDEEDFADEQNLVASVIHLLRAPQGSEGAAEHNFAMLLAAKKSFEQGGLKRRQHTHPALFFAALRLVQQLFVAQESDADWAKKARRVIRFAYELVVALEDSNVPQVTLNLYLQCSLSASRCGFDNFAYEFFTKAFTVYEDKMAKEQYDCIRIIIATARQLHSIDEENMDVLAANTAQHAGRLMKRHEQCRAVSLSSHLFWQTDRPQAFQDAERVYQCLLKARKVADQCVDDDMNVELFVEIANEYLYYFESDPEAVAKRINPLLLSIKTTYLDTPEQRQSKEALWNHYKNTIQHIVLKKSTDPRYNAIEIPAM